MARVLVTGASGFLAQHIILQLLAKGYGVRGTLRSLKRADEVRGVLAKHEPRAKDIEFVEADLSSDAGWAEATCGAATGQLVIAKAFGVTQTNALASAAGFLGWKIKRSEWGYGTFNLALTFPGTVTNAWDATLVRQADGTMIKMQ